MLRPTALSACAPRARCATSIGCRSRPEPRWLQRHRAHALGHARRAERDQCASACLAATSRRGAQRHHREPRGTARASWSPTGFDFASQTDTEVIAHMIERDLSSAACRCYDAVQKTVRAPARRLRDRGDLGARAGHAGRRAAGLAAGGRLRRRARTIFGSDVHALIPLTRNFSLPGRRRRRRDHPAHGSHLRCRGPGNVTRPMKVIDLQHRRRVEGRLRALHAQGNPRAAAVGGRHAGRAHCRRQDPDPDFRRRCGATAAGHRGRAHHRLRHQLSRRPGGAVLDRATGRRALHCRNRQRIPLSRSAW